MCELGPVLQEGEMVGKIQRLTPDAAFVLAQVVRNFTRNCIPGRKDPPALHLR